MNDENWSDSSSEQDNWSVPLDFTMTVPFRNGQVLRTMSENERLAEIDRLTERLTNVSTT